MIDFADLGILQVEEIHPPSFQPQEPPPQANVCASMVVENSSTCFPSPEGRAHSPLNAAPNKPCKENPHLLSPKAASPMELPLQQNIMNLVLDPQCMQSGSKEDIMHSVLSPCS